jgi:hypothetical protein
MTNQHLPIGPEVPYTAIDRSIGEIRLAISSLKQELVRLAARLAEVERQQMRGAIQGLPGNWIITPPPGWGREDDGGI